jgi:hypothetical protein
MRIDELTRELHAQADEAMSTADVRLSDLRARRTRERRRLAVAGAAVAVLVTMGGVALLDPGSSTTAPAPGPVGQPSTAASTSPEPSPSDSPSPSPSDSPSPDSAGSADWQPVDCNQPELGGCDIPATLTYRGHTYTDRGGASGSQPVLTGNGVNRELRLAVVPADGPTLVLVGATERGAGSNVGVSVNWALTRPLLDGPMTALLLKKTPDSQTVVVVEDGTAGPDEVLHIATYTRTD